MCFLTHTVLVQCGLIRPVGLSLGNGFVFRMDLAETV
jgi:hypothetical protein